MNSIQYIITSKGQKALETGDHLIHLANEAARDGVLTSKEITSLSPELTTAEADVIISLLSKSGFIEPAPIQGTGYQERGKYN